MTRSERVALTRDELVAKLALIAIHMRHSRREGEVFAVTIGQISAFITECSKEFDLSNDEQMLFLKYVVCGGDTVEELLKLKGD